MASVGTRYDKLYLDFRVGGHRYREYLGIPDTTANRQKVSAILKKMEADLTLGSFCYKRYFPTSTNAVLFEQRRTMGVRATDQSVKFSDFAETWFAHKRIEWRKSYIDTMRISLDRYIIPEFGDQPVTSISKSMILDFRASLATQPGKQAGSRLSASRINHVMTPLRMIITAAADEYGFMNPWRNIKSLKVPRTQVEPFSLGEVNQILNTVRPDYRVYFTVRFLTGLRTGEIDGLKWQYVDFERRQILIRQALVQGRLVPKRRQSK
ncbi:MAG: DUF3596 domain-containing protein, partial [Pseudomonadota bacterium]